MELTKDLMTSELKQIANRAWNDEEGDRFDKMYAACAACVEAVLKQSAPSYGASRPPTKEEVEAAYKVLHAHSMGIPVAGKQQSAPAQEEAPKRSLSEILEELCPGVRKRNWPAWAGPYKEAEPSIPPPKMTQDEEDSIAPAVPSAAPHDATRMEQDGLETEVCKILGRAETDGASFAVTATRLINFIRREVEKSHDAEWERAIQEEVNSFAGGVE
jgi:hypothetical protein